MKAKIKVSLIGIFVILLLGSAVIAFDWFNGHITPDDLANIFVFGGRLNVLQRNLLVLIPLLIITPFLLIKAGLADSDDEPQQDTASEAEKEDEKEEDGRSAVALEKFLSSQKMLDFESEHSTTKDRERDLAFGAVLLTQNWESSKVLPLMSRWSNLYEMLADSWGIKDAADAVHTMQYLSVADNHTAKYDPVYKQITSGQIPEPASFVTARQMLERLGYTRQELMSLPSIAAWDYGRCAFIVRSSLSAEYVDEETCWKYLHICADHASKVYGDWRQYLAAYTLGRALWGSDCQDLEGVLGFLLKSPVSPLYHVSI